MDTSPSNIKNARIDVPMNSLCWHTRTHDISQNHATSLHSIMDLHLLQFNCSVYGVFNRLTGKQECFYVLMSDHSLDCSGIWCVRVTRSDYKSFNKLLRFAAASFSVISPASNSFLIMDKRCFKGFSSVLSLRSAAPPKLGSSTEISYEKSNDIA